MQFTDTAEMAGARETADGYLVASVLCARTGCQDYLASEIGLDSGGVIAVYRPEDVVFDREAMQSFPSKPITIDHPTVPVDANNWGDLAVGDIVSVVREGEFIRADIKIMDSAAIDAVRNGKREISMGYSTEIEITDGVAPDGTKYGAVQTGPIRVNHLALVDRARGGQKLRIGDDAAQWGASPLTDAARKEPPMTLRNILVDGLQVETTDAGAQAIEKLKGQLADSGKALTDAEANHATAIADKDKEIATKDAEIEKLKSSQISDADIDARVEARATLVDTARKIHADVETKGVSDADIRKAVVSAKVGDAAIADKSDAYIEARFDVLAEDAESADPLADAMSTGINTQMNDGMSVADKAYADNVAHLQDAWKGDTAKQEA